MTFQQELGSWMSPTSLKLSPTPEFGSRAPSSEKLSFPPKDGKPTVLTFLRHCGCPFAEKTFLSLRDQAKQHKNVNFIAFSHSSQESTDKWLSAIGGAGDVKVIVDADRDTYAKWGLGVSSVWHVVNPWSMWTLYKMGKSEGIWNRPTESGTRWQTSGNWAVDGKGFVRWGRVANAADDVMDFGEGVKIVEESK